jgi:hypothetical protein
VPKSLAAHALGLASELRRLAFWLQKHNVCGDPSPLYKAAGQCRDVGATSWQYRVERLIFRLSTVGKVIPRKVKDVSIELSINVQGRLVFPDECCDPLEFLELDVVVVGVDPERDDMEVLCCWHLDRDQWRPEQGPQEYLHPIYHLQMGGYRLWANANNGVDFGASLVLEAPRLACPPLDAILAVDFVLTNFFPVQEALIRTDSTYLNLVRGAQERLWAPYIRELYAHWNPSVGIGRWADDRLWPQHVR